MSDLEARYDKWLDAALAQQRVWMIVGENGQNKVLEDQNEPRDLHMFFLDDTHAKEHADEDGRPEAIALDDVFVEIMEKAESRGDGLALWDGESWIVADPGPLGESVAAATG